MKSAILGALLILNVTGHARAEDGRISGSISTTAGIPVRGYPVVVTGQSRSGEIQNWVASTDADGTFAVDQLPPGEYTIAPANVPTAARSLEIAPDAVGKDGSAARELNIQLAPKDFF